MPPISFTPIKAPRKYGVCRKCGEKKRGRLYRSIMEQDLILICDDCMKQQWIDLGADIK